MEKEVKQRIIKGLNQLRQNFDGSDSRFAKSLDISPAIWSRIKNGETEKVLSDAKLISLARQYNIVLREQAVWKTAKTPVFEFITKSLEMCQQDSISSLLCDIADIGKTYTARIYAQTHKNAVYIDCSQVKTKQKLVRNIAKSFGVGHTGRYSDVYEDLVFYLRSIANPLIILDEAGDLQYDAFLELKALWNATERSCGWYMMGADGLKEKIRRAIDCKKVGFTELFSRYGSRYQKVMPESADERKRQTMLQAALIVKANSNNADVQKIIAEADGSLRRIYTVLSKQSA